MINSPIYLVELNHLWVAMYNCLLNDNIKSKSQSPKILSTYFSPRVTNLTGLELDQGNHPFLVLLWDIVGYLYDVKISGYKMSNSEFLKII